MSSEIALGFLDPIEQLAQQEPFPSKVGGQPVDL